MTLLERLPVDLDPQAAHALLAELGFLANSDLPDRPGPAYLLVAIRPRPTLHHFDPEKIDYWVTAAGRGRPREVSRETPLPVDVPFTWGLIRVVDRLGVSNEYLTFGGGLTAERVDDTVVAVFRSPAPLLRRGGHSQGWDPCAESVGAFFGRVLLTVDYVDGFEEAFGRASALSRYAAFVADTVDRYRGSALLRADHPELWNLVEAEKDRLRATSGHDWEEGLALSHKIASATRAG
jgi:hypothetical protein